MKKKTLLAAALLGASGMAMAQAPLWLRNAKIQRGEYTDWVDELLIKAMKAPVKKVKIHN